MSITKQSLEIYKVTFHEEYSRWNIWEVYTTKKIETKEDAVRLMEKGIIEGVTCKRLNETLYPRLKRAVETKAPEYKKYKSSLCLMYYDDEFRNWSHLVYISSTKVDYIK